MKPLNKVVTASDVQSCLYYVHANSLDDEKFREALLTEANQHNRFGDSETERMLQIVNGVQRKPVGKKPDPGLLRPQELPQSSEPFHHSSAQSQTRSFQLERKPVGDGAIPAPSTSMNSTTRVSALHLHGPRPMNAHLQSTERPRRRNFDMRKWPENPSERNLKSPQSPSYRPEQESLRPPPQPNEFIPERPESQARRICHQYGDEHLRRVYDPQEGVGNQNSRDMSLTLIRRYDNLQWNVGKIWRAFRVSSLENTIDTDYGRPLEESLEGTSIEILTPGYVKFTGQKDLSDDKNCSYAIQKLDQASQAEQPGLQNHDLQHITFKRNLWAANHKKAQMQYRRAESSESTLSNQGFRSKFKVQRPRQESARDEQAKRNSSEGSSSDKSIDATGYMFQSPWDGVCKFHTGVAGRSLKCKHTLFPKEGHLKAQSQSTLISELRFNLPSSRSIGGSPRKSKSQDGQSDGSKRSSLSAHHHRQRPSFGSAKEHFLSEDRLDLSLGQEHAGGGFGGKQAKLGKLIVEHEGLKMLDLVVAANIGLWWRVYEKHV